MNINEAKKITQAAQKQKRVEEERERDARASALDNEREQFRREWSAKADEEILNAAKRGESQAKIQIYDDLDFKRDAIRRWSVANGFTVEFSQEWHRPPSRDAEWVDDGGWNQNVYIKWGGPLPLSHAE